MHLCLGSLQDRVCQRACDLQNGWHEGLICLVAGGAGVPMQPLPAKGSDVFHHFIHIAEQDHGVIINPDHPAVMG